MSRLAGLPLHTTTFSAGHGLRMSDGTAKESAPMSDPEVALMLAFAKGEEEAFVKLYGAYRDRIVGYAYRLLNDQAQAEEAAQEVFLKIYRARDRYTPRSRFSTFIFRVATNHCLNLKARVEHKLVNRGADPEGQPTMGRTQDEHLAQQKLRSALSQALSALPAKQRAALVLVHYQGLSYREAADAVNVSESALKSLIHRARSAMMRELSPLLDAGLEVRHAV